MLACDFERLTRGKTVQAEQPAEGFLKSVAGGLPVGFFMECQKLILEPGKLRGTFAYSRCLEFLLLDGFVDPLFCSLSTVDFE